MIAEVINNGELSGGVEPKKQDGPNSDVVKNKKRKSGESEASENVKEKKPQLKKKKRRRQKRKKVEENGKIKEEGLDHNESRSTGLQLVVNTDESILRKNVETSLNIYVGGIPHYSTEDDIRSYFEGFGTITCIDCMTFPESGKSRGFAIITYETEAAAKRALALDGFDLGGVFLKIQPYKSATVNKLPIFSPSVVDGYNRVYIGNLSLDTTEVDLWKLFADCAVTCIRFGEDKETGEFGGCAHVDFADGLSLHTALKLDQTIVCGRAVRISCKNAAWTGLIFLPKEDSGKKLESTTKDNEVDKINVSVVENQVTSSGTNALSSKRRKQTCYKCRQPDHLSSACPNKLAANFTIPDNHDDSGKGNFTMFETTPRNNEVYQGNVSVVVENEVTSSVTNALNSKRRKQTCYKCRQRGRLQLQVDKCSSFCPKKLAVDSTTPDNHDDSGKGNFGMFEATPRDNEVDQSNVSVGIENQVTNSGSNALSLKRRKRTCYKCRKRGHPLSSCPKKLAVDSTNPGREIFRSNASVVVENQVTSNGRNAQSSKIRKRTCYKCRERGHLSSSCPMKLVADSTNPVTAGEDLPIHRRGCTPPVGVMPMDMTSVQGSVRSTLVRWLRPPYPWIKLNTDGSFDRDTGVASGGGLIRDHFGNLQVAFYMPLEATSSFDAELQALLHGLYLAKQFNRPIWIELDALEVVRLLESGRPGALQTHHTLINIRALMTQFQTWITHIFREGNRPADYMATMGVGSHALHLVYPHLASKYFMELVVMDQIGYPSFRVR